MSLTNGRAGAVFVTEGDRVALFASRGIDQHVLDTVQGLWCRQRESLARGETFYVPDRTSDRRLERAVGVAAAPASLAVVPVLDHGETVALLYVDSLDPHFCAPHDLDRLGRFSRIVVKAVRDAGHGVAAAPGVPKDDWETYIERTPVEDMEREKLLLLLNRNEWNIARVARLMDVTRRTIYLRLQRYNIPRERVRKTRPRPATT
jgi:GAF domain-containing protein